MGVGHCKIKVEGNPPPKARNTKSEFYTLGLDLFGQFKKISYICSDIININLNL